MRLAVVTPSLQTVSNLPERLQGAGDPVIIDIRPWPAMMERAGA